MIKIELKIEQTPVGGNEFGAGVRVLTSNLNGATDGEGATWCGLCMAINDYMRSRGVPDFDCLKMVPR